MRAQLIGPNRHLLTPEQYGQLFSTHGMTMIFLYAMPVLSRIQQLFVAARARLARHGVSPRLNALSYWIYVASGLFMYAGFVIGAGPNAGWFNYVPYASRPYNPGMNIDFYARRHDFPRPVHQRGFGELHRQRIANARAGHVGEPHAHSGVGHTHRVGRQFAGDTRGEPGILPALDGPPVRHAFLRCVARRSTIAVAASVLDVRPSVGLRRGASRHGHGL